MRLANISTGWLVIALSLSSLTPLVADQCGEGFMEIDGQVAVRDLNKYAYIQFMQEIVIPPFVKRVTLMKSVWDGLGAMYPNKIMNQIDLEKNSMKGRPLTIKPGDRFPIERNLSSDSYLSLRFADFSFTTPSPSSWVTGFQINPPHGPRASRTEWEDMNYPKNLADLKKYTQHIFIFCYQPE